MRLPVPPPRPPQANDGIRTRDPHLGKVVFYHWTTFALLSLYKKMPATWLEHATLWLQIRCSTNWAKPAHYYSFMRVKGLEPPRRKAPDPKSGASANSAKPAIMTRTGLEPVTHWLKVNCSTNWANESYHYLLETSFLRSRRESNPRSSPWQGDVITATLRDLWELTGSNRWPSACKADALPAELNSQMSLVSTRLNLAKRLPYLTGGNPQLLPAF